MKDSEIITHAIGCVIAMAKDDPFSYETFCTLEWLYESFGTAVYSENLREKEKSENV